MLDLSVIVSMVFPVKFVPLISERDIPTFCLNTPSIRPFTCQLWVRQVNKRPNGPVSLTWFLPFLFIYKTMTKGCYMPNIDASIGPQKGPSPLFEQI